jgi:hypothetical protein
MERRIRSKHIEVMSEIVFNRSIVCVSASLIESGENISSFKIDAIGE